MLELCGREAFFLTLTEKYALRVKTEVAISTNKKIIYLNKFMCTYYTEVVKYQVEKIFFY